MVYNKNWLNGLVVEYALWVRVSQVRFLVEPSNNLF